MKRHARINPLLIEIMIVVLFLSLALCVLIRVFVGARSVSARAQARNTASMEAQNLAEEVYAAPSIEALMQEKNDFVYEQDAWVKRMEGDTLLKLCVSENENTEAGVLRHASVQVYLKQAETPAFVLDCSRYLPVEVLP